MKFCTIGYSVVIAWGEELLDTSDRCLHELYEYSKKMGYIDKDAPYEKFVRREF